MPFKLLLCVQDHDDVKCYLFSLQYFRATLHMQPVWGCWKFEKLLPNACGQGIRNRSLTWSGLKKPQPPWPVKLGWYGTYFTIGGASISRGKPPYTSMWCNTCTCTCTLAFLSHLVFLDSTRTESVAILPRFHALPRETRKSKLAL